MTTQGSTPEVKEQAMKSRTDYEVGLMMSFECGELSEEKTLELFQGLVNSGLAWKLQGSYGRTARALLDAGLINPA